MVVGSVVECGNYRGVAYCIMALHFAYTISKPQVAMVSRIIRMYYGSRMALIG
jgi:hypothetical protein